MNLGRYRLLAQLGAGCDGPIYRAQEQNDTTVEVRLLSGARSDPSRWQALVKRLRLVALLDHPMSRRIHELNVDHNPAYLALEWVEGAGLADAVGRSPPWTVSRVVDVGRALAAVLAAAHRLGLAHGKLRPSVIHGTTAADLKVDFTGTETCFSPEGPFKEIEASCLAPEKRMTLASDVYGLGALLHWLLTGRPATKSRVSSSTLLSREASLPLYQFVEAMMAAGPDDRPTAREAEICLQGLAEAPSSQQELRATAALPGLEALPITAVATPAYPSTAATAVATPAFSSTPVSSTPVSSTPVPAAPVPAMPMPADGDFSLGQLPCAQLGRFRLLEKLGQGGMGTVYKAEDLTDGTIVAIKVLRDDWTKQPDAIRRFHKEARLLAEVNNPYVTNLVEVNEDKNVHYLALEYVAGQSLARLLAQRGKLDEPHALALMADVARALVDAHERGIVHRDIKPDNILLVSGGAVSSGETPDHSPFTTHHSPRVKLSDFGLARHVVQTESLNVTQSGAIIGTPFYMAPEQCTRHGTIDARTDVYAMGATLFHLLAGRPPFMGDSPLAVIVMHANEAPPTLAKLNPQVSDGLSQIVDKTLAKSPEARYANAGALLRDLERLLRGEPTSIAVHPRLPTCDPASVLEYDFSWELEASPVALWPQVSNTERLNRAIGLTAPQFTSEPLPNGGSSRFAQFRKAGLLMAWQEHPFEWIEARRMGVLREFKHGPFKWFVSVVELAPRHGGGTLLTHRMRLEPNGLVGRTVAAVEIGIKARRSLERVYRRIDAALTGKLGGGWVDAFEEPAVPSGARQRRLEALLEKLSERRVEPIVVEKLGEFLAEAPAQEVARIRPLALARRLGLDPEAVVAACLHGAREGLLLLLWDILCPVCRIPSQVKETLKALREHGHCEACNLDFELDFANSVELIFRAHPEIRDSELGVFCIGGPAHSPHVAAQARVGPGERIELDLALAEGAYRLRGPQLPFTVDFRVEAGAPVARWDLSLSRGFEGDLPRTLRTGGQVLALVNDFKQEVVVRVERTAPRDDALTAARAASMALFRELYPAEVLAPGQLISVATVTLLVTNLEVAADFYEQLGDARAFGLIHEHFRLLDERIRREGGALVKAVGEGLLAAFSESVSAVRAGLALQQVLAGSETTRDLRLRVGIHRGSAMAATLNDHLDYFGATVNAAFELPRLAPGGGLVLSNAVAVDPQVATLLQSRNLQGEIVEATLQGKRGVMVHRFRV